MNRSVLHSVSCGFVLVLWLVVATGAAMAATSSGPAKTPASKPTTTPAGPIVLPLAKAPPQPLRHYTLDELEEMFPAFKHEPFDSAGYNHFSLPIHYEDRAGDGDANEAMAMSFLLSSALDWGDGCYCSRHAFFVFKRSSKYMPALMKKYDPKLVGYLVTDWQASHGVGGKLIRCKHGYAGVLTIFDRKGKVVKEVTYDKPRGFFDLLGDMAVDAICFLSTKPNEALVKHLHFKQCKHRQSLIDLGRAAFVEERSDQEWAIYNGILKRDPDFALVRYWRANQSWWQNRDNAAKALDVAKSINSHITLQALQDFRAAYCRDKALAAKYPQWCKQAEELAGPDSIFVIGRRLGKAVKNFKISPELLKKATAVGAKYPNHLYYLRTLAMAYYMGGDLPVDVDMAISILVAALQNDYLTGVGNKDSVVISLAHIVRSLGYYDLCVDLATPVTLRNLKENGMRPVDWDARMLGDALFQMGRFEESWQWYRKSFKARPERTPDAALSLVGGAAAAAYAGRKDIIEQILRDRRDVLEVINAVGLVEGYLDVLEGRPVNTKAIWSISKKMAQRPEQQILALEVQSDLLQHRKGRTLGAEPNWHRYDPRCRSLLILCHEVFRQDPDNAPGSFYEMLQLLHPDDPWAQKSVAQWRRWANKTPLPDPDQLIKDLADYAPESWPKADPARRSEAGKLIRKYRAGTFPCAIRQLIAAKRFDKAMELALRHHHLIVQSRQYMLTIDAAGLVRLVQRASEEASRPGLSPADL